MPRRRAASTISGSSRKAESGSGWGYAVFGKVVSGQDVVDAIEQVKTGRKGMHDDVPLEETGLRHPLDEAIGDGLAGRLDRDHDAVLRLAQGR